MTNQEAIDYLMDPAGKGLEAHEEAVAMAVMSAPVVDAIPIEWIERYIKCEDMLVGYAKNYILWMLSDWRKEQEKQNDF